MGNDPFANCTKETCPVGDSVYGYAPNKPANIIFGLIFAVSFVTYLVQCIRGRAWSFLIAMCIGTATETFGYVGRVLLSSDPFSSPGFKIQIICLTFAPAFLAAGLYLTLKHIVIVFGENFSRIRPTWYTWLFIFFDIFSILLQSGGATLAAVGTNTKLGNNVMLVGLSSQVVTLFFFGVLAAEYAFRVYKHQHELNPATVELRQSSHFRNFLIALTVAYLAVMTRCSYRVAEMAGGWRNNLMRNQAVFIALDSVMCIIMVVALNIWHPNFIFRLSREQSKYPTYSSSEMDEVSGAGNAQGHSHLSSQLARK